MKTLVWVGVAKAQIRRTCVGKGSSLHISLMAGKIAPPRAKGTLLEWPWRMGGKMQGNVAEMAVVESVTCVSGPAMRR